MYCGFNILNIQSESAEYTDWVMLNLNVKEIVCSLYELHV